MAMVGMIGRQTSCAGGVVLLSLMSGFLDRSEALRGERKTRQGKTEVQLTKTIAVFGLSINCSWYASFAPGAARCALGNARFAMLAGQVELARLAQSRSWDVRISVIIY